MSRELAWRITMAYLADVFPKHFRQPLAAQKAGCHAHRSSTNGPRPGRDRAREFAREELIPWEVEAELHEGKLPPEVKARHKKLAVELGLQRDGRARRARRPDLRVIEQVAVVGAARPRDQRAVLVLLRAASLDVRGLHAASRSSATCCRSCTASARSATRSPRAAPGSDVAIETTARRAPGGYLIRGEKWYVTSANHADFFILQALADGRTPARIRCSSSTRTSRASSWCARRRSATPSATTTRSIASTTCWCRKASASAPKATACSTRTAGSAASG